MSGGTDWEASRATGPSCTDVKGTSMSEKGVPNRKLRKSAQALVRRLRQDLEGRCRRDLAGAGDGRVLVLEVEELADVVQGVSCLKIAKGGFLQ
ncbi:hypothetical protein PC116_g33434, partial [Phytophthora cactorum]